MTNYYTLFSEAVSDITPEEERWLRDKLRDPQGLSDEEYFALQRLFPEIYDMESWPGFNWTFEEIYERYCFWFYSEDSGNVEYAIMLVEAFLREFRPDKEFLISWAHTCSSPRLGAFSGGEYICNKQGG